MDTEKRRPGRPRKSDNDRRSREMCLRLTHDEYDRISQAADGMPISIWCRDIILHAAAQDEVASNT